MSLRQNNVNTLVVKTSLIARESLDFRKVVDWPNGNTRVYNCLYNVYTLFMKTKIQKWGNSLGVRLPKSITEQKSLREGLRVSVILKDDQILLQPEEGELSLDSLLSEIDAKNLHHETEWSEARGNEVW